MRLMLYFVEIQRWQIKEIYESEGKYKTHIQFK